MQLSYRGVKYERPVPTLEVTDREIAGTYRGAPWRHQVVRAISAPQPNYTLRYRGVTYNSNDLLQPAAPSAESSLKPNPANSGFSIPLTTRTAIKELGRIHRLNLRQNLERRLRQAKAQGNQELIRLLELEFKQLAL
jgi:hypothetical protein